MIMTKREQYHLQFYKKNIPNEEPFFSILNEGGLSSYQYLTQISFFPYDALTYLVETIEQIEHSQPYEVDFYLNYEEFIVADLGFNYPYLQFAGVQTIL
jgi:hypothetical protein